MRAITITRHGGPGVLEVRESPDPTPGEGQVRVAAKACGLNFAEVMARQGLYPDAPKPPCVVGYEGAGVIDAVGPGVKGLKEGDRVLYLSRFGGHASHVVVPVAQAVPMPEKMTFEQGAAIPVVYLTAYHMLFRVARVRPRERVLVHMAAGGVGIAVLQLARTVEGGLELFGTASASKHDKLRELGCDHPIDYRSLDYVAEVRRLTNGEGVDVVLDALGGPDWTKGFDLLREGGMLVAFGLANANTGKTRNLFKVLGQILRVPRFTPMKLMDVNKAVSGVNVGHMWSRVDMLREEIDEVVKLFEKGVVDPVIDGTYPFERAGDAHERLGQGKNVGKVLLIP
jgi:NADPH:quinone reductase-like Zn-dependent oxidoreductase